MTHTGALHTYNCGEVRCWPMPVVIRDGQSPSSLLYRLMMAHPIAMQSNNANDGHRRGWVSRAADNQPCCG